MKRWLVGFSVMCAVVALGCEAREDTDADSGETDDTACPDPESRDYDSWELFERVDCIDEPSDVLQYRALDLHIEGFFSGLRDEMMLRVDADCLEDCDAGADASCQEANCTTVRGDEVQYFRVVTTVALNDEYFTRKTTTTETLEVRPPAGQETWGKVYVESSRSDFNDSEDNDSSKGWQAEWVGVLRPEWPPDFGIVGSWKCHNGDAGSEAEANLTYGSYNVSADCMTSDGLPDPLNDGRSGLEDCFLSDGYQVSPWVEVNANRVGLTYDMFGWVNDRCVGQIDRDTWEVIIPCGESTPEPDYL